MTGPLSFMVGLQPAGLDDFIARAHPAGVYGLNHCPAAPGLLGVLRIQNSTWDRLPEACQVDRYFESQDPIASADYELLGKTCFVPKAGDLNLIGYWQLTPADWYAPYNEWVLDQGPDAVLKAEWMNAWTCRALEIAHEHGLRLCIGSFATGNPGLALLPNLYPMLRLAKKYDGILDTHEYGVEGPLMGSASSGALYYRKIYHALPEDCRVPIVISEFWWGNGFEPDNVAAQIADAAAYGRELVKDDYLLWASAFQLDQGAESCFSPDAVSAYAAAAAGIQKEEEHTMPFIFGVHSPASPGDLAAADLLGIQRAAKFTGYKFLAGDTPNHYQQILELGFAPANCLTRLFIDLGGQPKPTPAQFAEWMGLAIYEAMSVGVTWFELHNEPNIPQEWSYSSDPHDFISWALQVIALLRAQHPGIRLVSPGLSPQPNTPQWWIDFGEHGLFDACDAIGAHVYWPDRQTMLTQAQGLNFIPLLPVASASKPIFITEYCNNIGGDADREKGLQYVDWAAHLQTHYPTVTRAYLYIISSNTPAENETRQTIVRNGVVSQIADGIRDGTPPPPADEWEFLGHFDAGTGALISDVLDFSFVLLADTAIETRYQKKSTGEVFTFQWSVSPAECAGRVTVSHPNGAYPAGTPMRIVAT